MSRNLLNPNRESDNLLYYKLSDRIDFSEVANLIYRPQRY